MIEVEVGTIHYVQANKKTQRIGVAMGGRQKVAHFNTTLDEQFNVGDTVYVKVTRENPDAAN